jgi:alkylhydroperoxidase family enzyme
MELKRLVGLVRSTAAGCQHCVAHHNAHGLEHEGIEPARQQAVWDFEGSPLFTPAERAALRISLESAPRNFAAVHIARHGWRPDPHDRR